MYGSSRLGKVGRRVLAATVAATAMLIFAAGAAAAPSLIASGATTLTINHGFEKKAERAGIGIAPVKPTRLRGAKATLRVTGGEIAPTAGIGRVAHGGGLKLKLGRRSVAIRHIEIDTRTRSLRAKVAGRRVRLARLVRPKVARVGFGDRIAVRKLKLTGAGARALDRRLGPPPGRTRAKRKGRAATKVAKVKPPFRASMAIGKTVSVIEPETVTVLPTGATTFDADPTLLAKLTDVGAAIEVIPPTTNSGTAFGAPIDGGTISPFGTSGQIDSGGGLRLAQNLPNGSDTTIALGAIGVDLAAKTASAEVSAASNFVEPGSYPPRRPLDLGDLPRTSIADLRIADVASDPTTRTVTVAATATLQVLAAEVLEGLVKAYQSYYEQTLLTAEPGRSAAEARAAAEARVAADRIATGEPLGSFSFTASGE